MRRRWGRGAAAGLLLLAVGTTAGRSGEPERPPGHRMRLSTGDLFVPAGFQARESVEITVHLHGAARVAEREFVRSGLPGVLVSVVLPGLSTVYSAKLRDRAVFQRLLEEARFRAAAGAPAARVTVSSFSAGFGGVRELLRDPEQYARIDALVLADSLHAGLALGVPRQPEPAHLEGFVRFARDAAAGRKRLVVTHSQIRPDGYASTTETTDALLGAVEGERETVSELWPGGMRLQSRFRRGGMEVLGFAGDSGPEHMLHLHHLAGFLARAAREPAP